VFSVAASDKSAAAGGPTLSLFPMHCRILLLAAVAISVPKTSVFARTQEMSSPGLTPSRVDADFHFDTRARISLQALWQTSDASKQERVACIGGYQHADTTYITRVEPVSTDADSLQATAGTSLQECRPPEWLGTVHTHVARIDGHPYVTFSGSDRAVLAAWHRRWQADGVFCVLYDDRRAHCEAGDDRTGDTEYAYGRGNNLAQ
jgi:hypothetical protein